MKDVPPALANINSEDRVTTMLPNKPLEKNITKLGEILLLVLVVFSTVTYAVSLLLGPILFYTTPNGIGVASRSLHRFSIDVFMAVTIPINLQATIGSFFAAIWLIFVLCITAAWFDRGGLVNSVKNLLSGSGSLSKSNFLVSMPIISTGLLSTILLIQQLEASEGVKTGGLSFPPATSPYIILINLATAPITEEIAFRITTIGIPLAIFLLIRSRHNEGTKSFTAKLKMLLLSLLSPERAKRLASYRNIRDNGFLRGISPLEWTLIIATSAVFGLAHYLSGAGWQAGKISTAFLAGLFLGITFVSYGVYADILLHWFFNYYFTIFDMAKSAYGGVFSVTSNMVEAVNLTVGYVIVAIFVIWVALKLGNHAAAKAVGAVTTP